MSKLLRITTTENDGTFDSDLDSSFELPPNSTVALQSTNFSFNTNQLKVNAYNDVFNIFLEAIPSIPCVLKDRINAFEPGQTQEYNNTNYQQFLDNFTAAINHEINTKGNVLNLNHAGVQALASVDNAHKVNIECKKSLLLDWNGDVFDTKQLLDGNMNTGGNHFRKAAGNNPTADPPIGDAFVIDKVPICVGGGFARVRIKNLQAAVGLFNGFHFGVVDEDKRQNYIDGAEIDADTDFTCCVSMVSDTDRVKMRISDRDGDRVKKADGSSDLDDALNITPTNVADGADTSGNDGIAITIEDGRFIFRYYDQANPAGRLLNPSFAGVADEDQIPVQDINFHDPRKNYYVAIVIEDLNTRLEKVGACNDPFFTRHSQAQETRELSIDASVMSLTQVPNIPSGPTFFDVSFLVTNPHGGTEINAQLRNFLGFDPTPNGNLNVNEETRVSYKFTTEKTVRALLSSETFLIQLVSLPVESYDTISGKKENTIYTIVENTVHNQTQEISFNSQYPIYIQLKNRNPILLRRLKARIVDHELLPIQAIGESQMTLLFGEE